MLKQLQAVDLFTALRQNNHPSGSYRGVFADGVKQAQAEARRMDKELARLRASIVVLSNQRMELQKYVRHAQSLLSPIRRLPPDIMSRILVYCCPSNDFARNINIPGTLVGSVCKHWRDLTLAMPEIWSTVWVDLDNITEWGTSILEIILQRSDESPLKLTVWSCMDLPDHSPAFQLLVEHCRRWYNVATNTSDSLWDWDIASQLQGNLPRLEHLSTNNASANMFEIAPCLRSIHIIDYCPEFYQLPQNQLSMIELGCRNVSPCLSDSGILSLSATCLRRLSILADEVLFDDVYGEGVTLSRLVNFSISAYGTSSAADLAGFFRGIHAPSLKTVAICAEEDCYLNPIWPQGDFISFLSPSLSSINSLSLVGVPMTDEQVIAVLGSLTSLHYLFIDDTIRENKEIVEGRILTKSFINRLNNHSNPEAVYRIVDTLKTIKLVLEPIQGSLWQGALVEMIQSRWTPGHLRRVELKCKNWKLSPSFISALKNLQEAGMRVLVRDSTGLLLVD